METMSLVLAATVDPAEWDGHAERLGGGFYHCHAGVTYMAERAGAKPLFVRAVADDARCVGLAAGYVARSRLWPLSRACGLAEFSATPVAGGNVALERALLALLEAELRRRGVHAITFASYHSPNSAILLPEAGYELLDRWEYDFDLMNELDHLFAALVANRRNDVRRAEKRGVVTEPINSPDAVNLVHDFHRLSMERRGIDRPSLTERAKRALHQLLESGRACVLVSRQDGQPVGAEIFGVFNGLAYGMMSGSSPQGNQCFSPVHLTWQAVKHFRERGFHRLSLGGAKIDESSLRKFKQKFGTLETPQPAGSKVLSRFGASLDRLRSRLRR